LCEEFQVSGSVFTERNRKRDPEVLDELKPPSFC
jgi:hypothetical protein